MSFYSHNETSLAMFTLEIWCRVVRSRDVSLHNFDGLAMSGLTFSVALLVLLYCTCNLGSGLTVNPTVTLYSSLGWFIRLAYSMVGVYSGLLHRYVRLRTSVYSVN